MSDKVILLLIVAFLAGAITSLLEKDMARFLYFTGAIILNFGILFMN